MGDDTESSSKTAGDKDKAGDSVTLVDNTKNNNSSDSIGNSNDSKKADDSVTNFKPSPRFWAILITCAVIGLLSALENTVVTTALPYIVADFEMGENYVWITNIFFLTGYVLYRDDKPRAPLLTCSEQRGLPAALRPAGEHLRP